MEDHAGGKISITFHVYSPASRKLLPQFGYIYIIKNDLKKQPPRFNRRGLHTYFKKIFETT
ncbi:MAG TPA: hypothetical protein DEF59_02535 [Candidatus Magasanikbacteria bacterium]|nr:hypothetical protein [Candidatus Magasanikbacteria bacterium]